MVYGFLKKISIKTHVFNRCFRHSAVKAIVARTNCLRVNWANAKRLRAVYNRSIIMLGNGEKIEKVIKWQGIVM